MTVPLTSPVGVALVRGVVVFVGGVAGGGGGGLVVGGACVGR